MEVIERLACRAILLTPEKEILLMKFRNPNSTVEFWATPGGGLEPGEDERKGLERELFEELGLQKVSIGPHVWSRFHQFDWEEKVIKQHEAFFQISIEKFEPDNSNMIEGVETRAFREMKWWDIGDIRRSTEIFAPRDLGNLLFRLLEEGPPFEPFQVGI